MVRGAGLEPASLSALGPKPSAFAISPAALACHVACGHNIPCPRRKTNPNGMNGVSEVESGLIS